MNPEQIEQDELLAMARMNMINKRFGGRVNGKFEEKVSIKQTSTSPKKKPSVKHDTNNDDDKTKSYNQKNQENFGERKRIKP